MKGLPALASLFTRSLAGGPPVGSTPADVVHRENKLRLLRYRPGPRGVLHKTPILLVPSLINRHYVLDLLPEKSFAGWLVAQGHEVYIIDWGTPGDEDRFVTFDDVCDRYIGRAVRVAARASERGKVHLLGYCLGGTLTTIYTAARPDLVASLVALAAPVRFESAGIMATWTRSPTFDVRALVDGFGNVPWQLLQSAFQMIRPTLNASKLVSFLDRAWSDVALDGFVALETWGNDNVSFPGACYQRYIEDLYRKDLLVKGEFSLSGRPARLEDIRCPLLAVTFENDAIVPWQAAADLADRAGSADKARWHLPGGHVGAVVSQNASTTLWPKLSAWWLAHEEDAKPVLADHGARPPSPRQKKASPAKAKKRPAASKG